MKLKPGRPAWSMIDRRVEFQQALVNGAELLHIERGIVDPPGHAGRAFLVPGQPPEGVEQIAIGDREAVERLNGEQVAVEHRQPERRRHRLVAQAGLRLLTGQQVPQDPQRLPEVVMVGERGPMVEHAAQPGDPVMLAVERARTENPRSSETSRNRKR